MSWFTVLYFLSKMEFAVEKRKDKNCRKVERLPHVTLLLCMENECHRSTVLMAT